MQLNVEVQDVGCSQLAAPDDMHSCNYVTTMQDVVKGCSKPAASKAQAALLPAVAKATNDATPTVREAAVECLVAFAMKTGISTPAKVTSSRALDPHCNKWRNARARLCLSRSDTAEGLAAVTWDFIVRMGLATGC